MAGQRAAPVALYPLAQVEEMSASMGGRGMTYKEAKRILYPDNNLFELETRGDWDGVKAWADMPKYKGGDSDA